MDLGLLIREERVRRGLSQARLALRARTTQAVVSRIERGQVAPSVDTAERLLAAMGLDLTYAAGPSRLRDHDAAAAGRFARLTMEQRLAAALPSATALDELRGAAARTP